MQQAVPTLDCTRETESGARDSETLVQLVIEQPVARPVRLKPLAVDDQLRDGPLAYVAHNLGRGIRISVHIDLCVGDAVGIKKLLGCAAVAAPCRRINLHVHVNIVLRGAGMLGEMTAREIKALLKLEAHPIEGGCFRQTYASSYPLDLPRGQRPAGTAIYYLLEAGTFSEMHRLDSDEIFHFYLGDPVEMLQLYPGGGSAIVTLGQDLQAGQQVQVIVPAGVWQGTRLIGDGKVALLGCTVTPGFDYADYQSGNSAELVAHWPAQAERIRKLTRT